MVQAGAVFAAARGKVDIARIDGAATTACEEMSSIIMHLVFVPQQY